MSPPSSRHCGARLETTSASAFMAAILVIMCMNDGTRISVELIRPGPGFGIGYLLKQKSQRKLATNLS